MTRTLLFLLGTVFLTACGQKGALYLPPPENEPARAAPAPAAVQPEDAAPAEEPLTSEENRLLSPEIPPAPAPGETPAAAPADGGGESPPEIQPLSNP
jgi:predicted small lipoprotein YifL